MNTKELKITIPEGYEIDESLSTFSNIVFKEITPLITSKLSNFNVGDTVKVVDGSCNWDVNTSEERYGLDELFTNNAKVIKNNLCIFQPNIDNLFKPLIWKYADLMLEFSNGTKIYCSSEMCQLASKKQTPEELMTEIWRSCNNVKYSSDNCRTYFKDNVPMIQQDWGTKRLYYSYQDIYKIFSDEYKMDESLINSLVLSIVSKDLNVKELVRVVGSWFWHWGLVE